MAIDIVRRQSAYLRLVARPQRGRSQRARSSRENWRTVGYLGSGTTTVQSQNSPWRLRSGPARARLDRGQDAGDRISLGRRPQRPVRFLCHRVRQARRRRHRDLRIGASARRQKGDRDHSHRVRRYLRSRRRHVAWSKVSTGRAAISPGCLRSRLTPQDERSNFYANWCRACDGSPSLPMPPVRARCSR